MIFDIKLGEHFQRKSCLVTDRYKIDTPSLLTYSTIVSRDAARVCLLIVALNDLDVLSGDIEKTYLTAQCREKCWTRVGSEFEQDKIRFI